MEEFLGIHTVHLRLTTKDDFKKIEDFIKGISKTYLLSQEDPGEHQHYHVLLQYQDTSKSNDKLRYMINSKLKLKGNGKYSISTVRNRRQLMKYILKDGGKYSSSNIPEEVLTLCKMSSNKKGKKSFAEDLAKVEDMYYSDEIGYTEFKEKFIQLKIDYGQSLYISHIQAYCYKVRCKKSKSFVREFARMID